MNHLVSVLNLNQDANTRSRLNHAPHIKPRAKREYLLNRPIGKNRNRPFQPLLANAI
ncbi:MAG: hypothetical protein ACTTJE_04940 [Schwartzia sp. (in: firmicutes)]